MPEKRPPKKPKKPKAPVAHIKPPKLPTKKWQEFAATRGYNTACELSDELLNQILATWSESDPQKAAIYLWGVLQGIAIQVGRLESLLAHSGYAHPQILRHMCISRMAEAYGIMCDLMKHGPDESSPMPSHTLEELMEAVTRSSIGPRKPAPATPAHENVIPLPVFNKKEE